ncbi:MAG TPA: DNRLRE domain-containing protein [Polyangiaceae bacterium]|nr:DNRLRE domain-containing protein [Polyangiaceae bacterium]
MSKKLFLAVLFCAGLLGVLKSRDALAHPTTSTCWEQWQSSFALSNAYDNFRLSFLSWSKLDSSGKVARCPPAAGQSPGCADSSCTSTLPWPGYNSPCWFWRRRCGEHYIHLEDDAGEGHTWFEEWGSTSNNLRLCDPNDGKGSGFVAQNSSYQSPNCQNWTQGNLRQVTAHASGWSLILWSEHTSDHKPVIYDLQYLQIFPSTTVEVAIKIGSGENDWYITTLAPNEPNPSGADNGYYYYDVTSWGWEVERTVFRSAPGQGGPPVLGGIYYSTPSQSDWPTQTDTLQPVADAYVRDGSSANTNFGTTTDLQVKSNVNAGDRRRTFLRFDITAVKSTVVSAKLRLWGNASTSAKSMSLYAQSPFDLWNESTITWNNMPTLGAVLLSKSIGTTAAWQEFDVTARLQALKGGMIPAADFALKADANSSNPPSTFNSREGTNKPELVVVSK